MPGFDIPAGQWFPAEFGCSSRTPSRPSGNRGSHAGAGLVPVQPRCLAGLKTRLARETFLSFGGNHACHRRDRHACLYRARRRAYGRGKSGQQAGLGLPAKGPCWPGRDCHEEDPRMRPTFHIRSWRPRLGRGVAVLTAAVLGCAGLAAVAAAPASAAPVCQVAYTVNTDWGPGSPSPSTSPTTARRSPRGRWATPTPATSNSPRAGRGTGARPARPSRSPTPPGTAPWPPAPPPRSAPTSPTPAPTPPRRCSP